MVFHIPPTHGKHMKIPPQFSLHYAFFMCEIYCGNINVRTLPTLMKIAEMSNLLFSKLKRKINRKIKYKMRVIKLFTMIFTLPFLSFFLCANNLRELFFNVVILLLGWVEANEMWLGKYQKLFCQQWKAFLPSNTFPTFIATTFIEFALALFVWFFFDLSDAMFDGFWFVHEFCHNFMSLQYSNYFQVVANFSKSPQTTDAE